MKKLFSAIAGVLVTTAIATAPIAAATPSGPRPANGTIAGYETTLHPGSSLTLTIEPNSGVDYAGVQAIYLKFDDGLGYGGSSSHGGAVVVKVNRQSSGKFIGTIPCSFHFTDSNVANGQHWLRGLAKAPNGTVVSAKSQENIVFNSTPDKVCRLV